MANHAIVNHHVNVRRVVQVLSRVCIEHNHVGKLPSCDATEDLVESSVFGTIDGGGLNSFHRTHGARSTERPEFPMDTESLELSVSPHGDQKSVILHGGGVARRLLMIPVVILCPRTPGRSVRPSRACPSAARVAGHRRARGVGRSTARLKVHHTPPRALACTQDRPNRGCDLRT